MIYVDIDGTIAATGERIEELYGIPVTKYPSPLPEGFWETPEGLLVYRDAGVIPHSVKALNNFDTEVVYATIRSPETEFITRRWLDKHGFPKGRLVFCKDHKDKVQSAIRDGAVLIVDDDVRVVIEAQKHGLHALLIERPYNKGLNSVKYTTWEEINRSLQRGYFL